MAEYHAYHYIYGRIDGPAKAIVCDTDEQAIESAKQLLDGRPLELWEGERLTRTFRPGEP